MTLTIEFEHLKTAFSSARLNPEWAGTPAVALSTTQLSCIAAEVELHCAVGCLLRSRAFSYWLVLRCSRFPWVTGLLFDELTRSLRHGLDLLDYGNDPRCWRLAGVACSHRARRLAHQFNLPVPASLTAHYLDQPSPETLSQITFLLAELGRIHLLPVTDELEPVYRLLRQLAAVAQVRLTLEQPTGHAGFETILSELTTSWVLAGDLFQVLGEDAEHFRTGAPAQMLIYRDRAKTALFNPDQVPKADDWDEPGPDDYFSREAGWIPADPALACALVGLAPNLSGYPVGEHPQHREYIIVNFGLSGEADVTPGFVRQQLRASLTPTLFDEE